MPSMFRRRQVVEWFRQNYPAVRPNTVTAHITAATVNSPSRHHYPGADQHLIFKRDDDRLLERYDVSRHGKWDEYGRLIDGTGTEKEPVVHEPLVMPTIRSGQAFEEHARLACSRHWGVDLRSAVVEVMSGVSHQFDLVSTDGNIVGDAKWFRNLAAPSAKWSVIAEYVWLLQHLSSAKTRFIVFGQDREVPERWLKRFRPLTTGVEFYFLPDGSTDLRPL